MFGKLIRVNKNGHQDIFINPATLECISDIEDNPNGNRFEFTVESRNSYFIISREYLEGKNKPKSYPKSEKDLHDEREKLLSHFEII